MRLHKLEGRRIEHGGAEQQAQADQTVEHGRQRQSGAALQRLDQGLTPGSRAGQGQVEQGAGLLRRRLDRCGGFGCQHFEGVVPQRQRHRAVPDDVPGRGERLRAG